MSQKWLDILCKYLLHLTSKYLLNLTSKYLLDLLSKYINHMFGCPPSPPPIIPIIPVIPVSTYWTWPVSTYWTCLVSTWIICLVDHKIHQKWFIWGILGNIHKWHHPFLALFWRYPPPDHPRSPFEMTYPPPRKMTSFMDSLRQVILTFKTAPSGLIVNLLL